MMSLRVNRWATRCWRQWSPEPDLCWVLQWRWLHPWRSMCDLQRSDIRYTSIYISRYQVHFYLYIYQISVTLISIYIYPNIRYTSIYIYISKYQVHFYLYRCSEIVDIGCLINRQTYAIALPYRNKLHLPGGTEPKLATLSQCQCWGNRGKLCLAIVG